jgi:hypothetical protein
MQKPGPATLLAFQHEVDFIDELLDSIQQREDISPVYKKSSAIIDNIASAALENHELTDYNTGSDALLALVTIALLIVEKCDPKTFVGQMLIEYMQPKLRPSLQLEQMSTRLSLKIFQVTKAMSLDARGWDFRSELSSRLYALGPLVKDSNVLTAILETIEFLDGQRTPEPSGVRDDIGVTTSLLPPTSISIVQSVSSHTRIPVEEEEFDDLIAYDSAPETEGER